MFYSKCARRASSPRMVIYYLETSALLKRYRTEQGTAMVDTLFDSQSSTDILFTSQFTSVEIEASAARLLRGNRLSQSAYRTLLGRFAGDMGGIINIQRVSTTTVSRAAELARRYALRAADAMHLAEAVVLRQIASTFPVFMSSDRELVAAAQADGFTCLDPTHPLAVEQLNRLRTGST